MYMPPQAVNFKGKCIFFRKKAEKIKGPYQRVEANNPCIRSETTSQTQLRYANHFPVIISVDIKTAWLVPVTIEIIKHVGQIRMFYWPTLTIRNQVLLADIGGIKTFFILR